MCSDWVMVILTAIYSFFTILIFLANSASVKAIDRQLKEMKRQYDEANRAFVTAYFDLVRNGLMTLCVSNQGNRIATDIRLKIQGFETNNINKNLLENIERINKASFSLGAGQSWYFDIDIVSNFKELMNKNIEIEINYKDVFKTYSESTSTLFNENFSPLLYRSTLQDLLNEVREEKNSIKELTAAVKKIAYEKNG